MTPEEEHALLVKAGLTFGMFAMLILGMLFAMALAAAAVMTGDWP